MTSAPADFFRARAERVVGALERGLFPEWHVVRDSLNGGALGERYLQHRQIAVAAIAAKEDPVAAIVADDLARLEQRIRERAERFVADWWALPAEECEERLERLAPQAAAEFLRRVDVMRVADSREAAVDALVALDLPREPVAS